MYCVLNQHVHVSDDLDTQTCENETYACDFKMHECDFHTPECDFHMHDCVFDTLEYDLYT
jgi:hypothetical protein